MHAHLDRGRVFLLDDDSKVQAVLKRELESAGFRVEASAQWSEVVRNMFAMKEATALLVADLHVPGIKGEDFCRTILQYRKDRIRLLLFTDAPRGEVEAAATRLGVPFVLKQEGARRVCDLARNLLPPDVPADSATRVKDRD